MPFIERLSFIQRLLKVPKVSFVKRFSIPLRTIAQFLLSLLW